MDSSLWIELILVGYAGIGFMLGMILYTAFRYGSFSVKQISAIRKYSATMGAIWLFAILFGPQRVSRRVRYFFGLKPNFKLN